MCGVCGLPSTHVTTAQTLAAASAISFGLLTFISVCWVLTSFAIKRKIRSLIDKII